MITEAGARLNRPADQPYRVGFLLIENFTLIALATAVEPLRMANQLAGAELYSWELLTAEGKPACAQPKLAEIAQLMEANIEEPIELQELATLAGISRRQLERLFLKHLGCTPSRYYLRVRLNRARRLLKQTSSSIVEIASMCGFVSATHFSRCYRKTMGRAPLIVESTVKLYWVLAIHTGR